MKKIAYFTLGTAFGLALSVGSVAVAANTDLVAKIAGYSIKVNGQQKNLTNKPVVINGSTYLPLRETANIVGYSVALDGKTILLDSKSGTSTDTPAQSSTTGTSEGKAKVTYVKNLETNFSTNGKLDPNKLKLGIAAGEITVNSADSDSGESLLQIIIKEDNYAAYQVIKTNALDVNAQNKINGQTALHTAVILENEFYFSELTSQLKVDPFIKDKDSKIPRDYTQPNSIYDRTLKSYDPN